MVDGITGRNKWKDRKERNHLLRLKFQSKRAETQVG